MTQCVVTSVLIESDWNLKSISIRGNTGTQPVLIESDWNLKTIYDENITPLESSINRIRLEFKDLHSFR